MVGMAFYGEEVIVRWFMMIALLILLPGCQPRGKGKWVEEEVNFGHKGQARTNPYLAAERYLQKVQSDEVVSLRALPILDDEIMTLMMPADFLPTRSHGERLLEWVSEYGGTAIILAEGGSASINDYREMSFFWEEGETLGLDYIMEELDVTESDHN